ncbi:hypothetical protein GQS52_03590 [Streptomyces sp. SCUT-3]|uniref:DUF6011 domain-containing protein n=1 Tax=Streptomyces TaxID=1883 RepID=UPI0015FCCD17|nr:DUF6011 domain-containing protein [Streptomyces sp. SCUT-3]QMV21016.1 hypothetical protein GQS52_03590 [Streptomyces sp. SCUT-3]
MDASRESGLEPGQEPLPDTAVPAVGRRPLWCRRCRRPLTDRVSRMYGLGPECRGPGPRVRSPCSEVEQETLPEP